MRRRNVWTTFTLVTLLAAGGIYVALPRTKSLNFGRLGTRNVTLQEGLDLKGGVHLVYEPGDTTLKGAELDKAIEGVRAVIESRVNALGATEPEIRTASLAGNPAVIVDLPGFDRIEDAKKLIGATSKLTFQDETGTILLEGADLKPGGASYQPVSQTTSTGAQISGKREWEVVLEFTDKGKEAFANGTQANLGKRIGIFLDDTLISAPTVNAAITDGRAVISGGFTLSSARDFALSLNYGALPVPVKLSQEQVVGASLGADAVNASLAAGLVGVLLILIFMIARYRWLGLLASLALVLYAAFNIAVFKLAPITMTLAGIAGFIISIGIAVDTNILTFERLKEEFAQGKPVKEAVLASFKRSWSSIRDSHAAGLITAVIIFMFGSSGVRGFAVVLIVGTLLSLFTTITVTRNWMMLLTGTRLERLLYPARTRTITHDHE